MNPSIQKEEQISVNDVIAKYLTDAVPMVGSDQKVPQGRVQRWAKQGSILCLLSSAGMSPPLLIFLVVYMCPNSDFIASIYILPIIACSKIMKEIADADTGAWWQIARIIKCPDPGRYIPLSFIS